MIDLNIAVNRFNTDGKFSSSLGYPRRRNGKFYYYGGASSENIAIKNYVITTIYGNKLEVKDISEIEQDDNIIVDEMEEPIKTKEKFLENINTLKYVQVSNVNKNSTYSWTVEYSSVGDYKE